jgi:phosphate transport system protein
MVRESYQQQLEGLIESVSRLGEEAVEGLRMGLRAIRDHDRELAEGLDAWDDAIDRLTLDIEKTCTDLLALQQPVAVDLRLILSAFKIVTDLERVADLAVNLGEYAMASEAFVLIPKSELLDLGEYACRMIEGSLEAFRERDPEKAKEVIYQDKEMDQRCWDLRTELLTQIIRSAREKVSEAEARKIAGNVITVIWSIRDLERVGDHAVNICARTIYWLTANPEFI